MKTTKAQRKKIYDCNPGYGWLVFKSGENEVSEIEVYVGMDKKVRRVGNGEPLLPIKFIDEDGDLVEAT